MVIKRDAIDATNQNEDMNEILFMCVCVCVCVLPLVVKRGWLENPLYMIVNGGLTGTCIHSGGFSIARFDYWRSPCFPVDFCSNLFEQLFCIT